MTCYVSNCKSVIQRIDNLQYIITSILIYCGKEYSGDLAHEVTSRSHRLRPTTRQHHQNFNCVIKEDNSYKFSTPIFK